jgi:Pyruvate/2-oxoacid:ferredoxin oxidoreductase delta subunit
MHFFLSASKFQQNCQISERKRYERQEKRLINYDYADGCQMVVDRCAAHLKGLSTKAVSTAPPGEVLPPTFHF